MGYVNTRTDECMVGGSIFASKLNFKSELGSQDRKHKIIFIGDSHVRECASENTQILRQII
jgi:hypothetical protein